MTVAELIKALQETPSMQAEVVFKPALLAGVLTAATGSMAATAHGLSVGDRVHLRSVTTTTGAVADAADTIVFVKTVTDANNFITSATDGGAALTGTTNGTYTASRADSASVSLAAATGATFAPDAPDAESGSTDPGIVTIS